MDFATLDQQLRDSLQDMKLDDREREELRQLGSALRQDQIYYLRNRAFDLVRELIRDDQRHAEPALKWLEQVIRTLEAMLTPAGNAASACFSPGENCRHKIAELCHDARKSLDICVFTIADDRITEAILRCHARGVAVRIISDDEKRYDQGSDIDRFLAAGIPVRLDCSPAHMHHKFAIFDRRWLLNGSFNWTRSASNVNAENLLVVDNGALLEAYQREFDKLWGRYGDCAS